ncbi:hypothetical protein COV17_01405 [Candidatus Woesearchaeota archaeon CG10_big_fil_rev_8_21_14_0_10_36_11]|nr:MAG: hypothetical protein COV17_01405 [Candidatus Woesearchaeota archaeon CG10_big_fil_rev_8_21_14_0_10_36_11]
MVIFEILAVILVIFVTFSVATEFAGSTNTQKTFFAEDIRMMINTLIGTPGDASIEYPQDISGYTLLLNSEEIIVLEDVKEGTDEFPVHRYISLPYDHSASGSVTKTDTLCIEKQYKRITLKPCT